MKEIAMYIHIPFCVQKCLYCDFHSYSNMDHWIIEYMECLGKEMDSWEEKLKNYKIKSIFIGGGTPSIIPVDQMDKILRRIYSKFNLSPSLEFTIESNPGTLDQQKIKYYLSNNINRLSMGLQACQDPLLKSLGRIHSYEDFEKNYLLAREIGFNNINVDLMFGLSDQTIKQWQGTLDKIVKLKLDHISTYSLKIEENTVFGKLYNEGKLKLPSDEEDRNMYHLAINFLMNHGYKHYEISNFSKENKECIHNKIYWNNEEYIGFGLGAYSYINRVRFSNCIHLKDYIDLINQKKSPCISYEKSTREDEISETMFLGLRMIDGIEISKFIKRFGISPYDIYRVQIEKLKDQGLLKVEKNRIFLTRRGIDLSNQVFIEFLIE